MRLYFFSACGELIISDACGGLCCPIHCDFGKTCVKKIGAYSDLSHRLRRPFEIWVPGSGHLCIKTGNLCRVGRHRNIHNLHCSK